MRIRLAACALACALAAAAHATSPSVPAPADRDFPGAIELTVDARDVERRIIHVHESITGLQGDCVLLYPEWIPGWHAPVGPVERLAGLEVIAGGRPIAWTRDADDVRAFHVHLPDGTDTLEVDFDYLAPTGGATGTVELSRDLLMLDWNHVVLYPAGYDAQRIGVDARLAVPQGWTRATALDKAPAPAKGDKALPAFARFDRVSLEKLVDSPVFAGRHVATFDLDPGSRRPVRLDVFAERDSALAAQAGQVEAHRNLVRQADRLFGARHFAHYDFLLALSEDALDVGLEHHESSASGSVPGYFEDWTASVASRYVIPHEYVHSWNGKFRRPADLSTPNFNVPMRNSLLWVYEGLTQYWGVVLAARSGLWTPQQALDELALTAARLQAQPGRRWRSLQDTTHEEVLSVRTSARSWTSWQRSAEYYDEGMLVWLDADTLIRERSAGRRSLDDFARRFYGLRDGTLGPVTYDFDDLVQALNEIEPYDWAGFLRARVDAVGAPTPLDGVRRGGYSLRFDDRPGDFFRSREDEAKALDLSFSVGLTLDTKEATVTDVLWDGPAFQAQIIPGDRIIAVDGLEYSADNFKDGIRAAAAAKSPIELIVKDGDRYRVVHIRYADGLRYPHLVRDSSRPGTLDAILAPRS